MRFCHTRISLLYLFFTLALPLFAREKGTSRFTYTGTYRPLYRSEKKQVSAEVKKAEAFWAAFCNVAVHMARLQDEVVFETRKGQSGWYLFGKQGVVEILSLSLQEQGEVFICSLGDFLTIETRDQELHRLVVSDPRRADKLRRQSYPAYLAGIKILSVKYRGSCEQEDCECELTVEYP
ncbi:MAG: hypothetical protein NZM25_06735 [Leptospiraceae bacterium]|nr:hypothetical protein [Leptospiraceae bacterium]MDW8306870.1 hypothetical protein [Leptospiraceae bacterium]